MAAEIDCTACANCCRTLRPLLDHDDVRNLAEAVGVTAEQFTAKYLTPDEEKRGLLMKTAPCPSLEGGRCSHYSHRPKECRSYPHLLQDSMWSRLWGVVDNCAVCPIVYNVYELLKERLGFSG